MQDSHTIAAHQIAAWRSWHEVFDGIVYFNDYEEKLSSSKTQFIGCGNAKPSIKVMAVFASQLAQWVAVVNADIWVQRNAIGLDKRLEKARAYAAYSRRLDKLTGNQIDLGLDFFIAIPLVWLRVSQAVPKHLYLGRIIWDTWMMSFLCTEFDTKTVDISPSRYIFHPKHQERNDQSVDESERDRYLKWPRMANRMMRI